jgi:hypothetical protein
MADSGITLRHRRPSCFGTASTPSSGEGKRPELTQNAESDRTRWAKSTTVPGLLDQALVDNPVAGRAAAFDV